MRKTAFFILWLCLFAAPAFAPVSASAQSEGIAAVVNESAVSESDVAARMRLVLVSSGMPNNEDIRERLKPQVMNILIDEQIRLQEAERLGISISEEEIDEGIAMIARQNNLTREQFTSAMRNDGIKERTMRQQVEAQLAWNNVVQQEIRPDIEISDQQIDAYRNRILSRTGTDEYLVAEIFLPVNDQDDEGNVRQLANKLYGQLTERNAPFDRIAAQFSEGATASKGGMLGWIQEGQLSEELDERLARMDKGSISGPVRTLSGYHILLLRDKRRLTEENAPGREEITNKLGLEEMERRQRRYFLDLKADAFIEKRI